MENYLRIFFESLWNASLIPLGQEPTFFGMLAFGEFDMRLPAAVAVTGATLGQMLNWWIGTKLLVLQQKKGVPVTWRDKAVTLFNRYGVYALLFSWVPLGKMLPLIAGFLGTRPRTALSLIVIGVIFNYGRYVV